MTKQNLFKERTLFRVRQQPGFANLLTPANVFKINAKTGLRHTQL